MSLYFRDTYQGLQSPKITEIWTDSIAYAPTVADANNEASSNPAVTKFSEVQLTAIPNTDNRFWRLVISGNIKKPWIMPIDILNVNGSPSFGYQPVIFQGLQGQIPHKKIDPDPNVFKFDGQKGIVEFLNLDPFQLGYAIILLTCYQYTGSFFSDTPDGSPNETLITISSNLTNNYNLSVLASGTGFVKTGDNGDLGINSGQFLNQRIKVFRNGVEQHKGIDVVWINSTTLAFVDKLFTTEEIVVFS